MAASMTTTAITSAKWSDIVEGIVSTASQVDSPASNSLPRAVEGISEAAVEKKICPAARGTYQCSCVGEILVMLGHYGWIMAYGDIDHPSVGKTKGRIYVHKRDIRGKTRLDRGDVVSFFLYADEQRLGAEQCALERRALFDYPIMDGLKCGGKRSDADDCDDDFTQSDADASSYDADNESTCDESDAHSSGGIASDDVFVGLTNYKELAACFNQDDDYESVFVGLTNYKELARCFCHEEDDESMFVGLTNYRELAQCFSHDDADESDDGLYESDDGLAVVYAPLKRQQVQSDDSTSAGASSDSECEASESCTIIPPALNLPVGFRPPPGLSF